MRHGDGHRKFSMPKSQRRALFSNLTSALLEHEQITITLTRAKELRTFADNMITYAKKGDLNSRRLAGRYIFDKEIGQFIDTATGEVFETKQDGKKLAPQTVLRKLFSVIGVKYSSRQGGYTRIFRLPPRRGDASEMALIQLV